jgi:hypothetical protein
VVVIPITIGKTNDVAIGPLAVPPESKAIAVNILGQANIKIMDKA